MINGKVLVLIDNWLLAGNWRLLAFLELEKCNPTEKNGRRINSGH